MENENKYIEVNGTSYQKGTPKEVIDVLENARTSRTRIKLYYGDHETGRDWKETMDTVGTIGRSTGSIKVPLLIKLSKSTGGGAILTASIVKIKDAKTGKVLYQSSNYKQPKVEITPSDMQDKGYTHNVMVDGEVYGRHKSLKSAQILQSKIMAKGSTVKGKKRSLMSMANLVVADWRGEKINDWYIKNYPTDELGEEINDITFEDLWNSTNSDNIYNVIGVGDSIIRERLFEHLSEIYGVEYNYVYDRLFGSDKYAKGGNTPSVWCYSIGGL